MTGRGPRLGVVLFQLGGPDRPEAIEPFLYNLFSDPDIIDFPFARMGRKALAKIISSTRAKKVQHHYRVIGGASPIRKFTEQQAEALQIKLREQGIAAHCFVGMRYWHPLIGEAASALQAADCEEVVLLPLYPQYSSTTTGSSLKEWWRQLGVDNFPTHVIEDFYTNDLYLDAIVEKIELELNQFPSSEKVEILFSAHSLPVSVIEKGDPYQRRIEETARLVMEKRRWPNHHCICYQSKVGASRWLQPSLHSALKELASRKVSSVCVVPISFVSDHVETLGEIDHEAREYSQSLGIKHFRMTSGLNDSPKFIEALSQLVIQQLNNRESGFTRQTIVAALV